ncbi:glycerate kinase [Klebsiella michiganensis]|nr:glycerate kinase [Klebsiella michiganensis]
MKIVIALDSFKGSCSAQAACAAVAQGLRRVDEELELVEMPVSDGGEGLLSALAESPQLKGARWQQQRCASPYGLSVQAAFLILPGERAIIEMAQSCGLELTPKAQRDVRLASSFGLGEQVKAALDAGCRRLMIGLGGSATNDGGIGFAQALGARFWREDGTLLPVPAAGKDLAHIQRIDLSAMDPRLRQAEIQASCDVTNPLLGKMAPPGCMARRKARTRRRSGSWRRVWRTTVGSLSKRSATTSANGPAPGLRAVWGPR